MNMELRVIRAASVTLLVCSLLTPGPSVAAPVAGTMCDVFPVDNVWRMNVRGLPIHRKNSVWKRATHAGSTLLHPDFGPPTYGMPFDRRRLARRRLDRVPVRGRI
jgi:hypothetical protein